VIERQCRPSFTASLAVRWSLKPAVHFLVDRMGFTVTNRTTGRSFAVEEGETVLEAALRQGIGLPYGCKNGACGTCKARVVDGTVKHTQHSSSALPPAEQAKGLALLCSALPQTDLSIEAREITGFGDIPIRKMPARIAKIERVAPDVAIVSVQLPVNFRLQFRAGQYMDVILKDGARRQYSIATAPHADELLQLHIRHTPGGVFTDRLFGVVEPAIKEREIVRIEAPLGTFFLREDSERPIVLLAGGTGFAPIKAIAEHIFHKGINATRPVALYWGARAKRDLYMADLPLRWEALQPNFRYVPVLSEPAPEDLWPGRVDFVHRAVMQDMPDLSAAQVYACGAPVMVDAARRDFTGDCGLPDDQFFADAFTTQADLADA
jgi:CDP-4-dehydro-6-deoxyglucose reductase